MSLQPLLAGSGVTVLAVVLGWGIGVRPPAPPQASRLIPAHASSPAVDAPPPVSFEAQVLPMLEARCQPCHFAGGKMYARLPFDRPETIRTLGEKLFTRIRDEKERSLLRSFLAQEATTAK